MVRLNVTYKDGRHTSVVCPDYATAEARGELEKRSEPMFMSYNIEDTADAGSEVFQHPGGDGAYGTLGHDWTT